MPIDSDHEEWRQHLLRELEIEEPGRWAPRSFGCHELLDRVHLMESIFESTVINRLACVLREDWFRAAGEINERIAALYQKIGADHI
ncbi:MAG: hypothetical protein Q8K78_17410 [Planctomycetaceae bacterium]|nr:hypothetical protein [Planctomycetaceae bacterium]